jgi:PAS domain S-box-containing protein
MEIPLRVLLIEDSERDVGLEVRALKAGGYGVTYAVAETAAEMEAALVQQTFDIILSDHDLPQFDAPGALALLMQSGIDIPFIVVSGAIGEETVVALMKAGARDYVMKDRMSRLVPAVERALRDAESLKSRKQAEEALRDSEELLSLFMCHSPVYTFIKEVTPNESRVLQASDNYEQMIGIPGPKMIGRTMLELFPPEFAAKITAEDWAVVSSGNVLQQDEDLNGRNYTTIKFPITRRGKTLLAGYTIDITDRKHAEEALKETLVDLERSNKDLEQFAYVASHDLQEPLRMVASYTQLIARRYKDKLDADANEFIGFAVDGARRMQKMIDDLLSYSRVGTRRKPFKPVDWTPVLKQVVTNLTLAIEETGAVITHDPLPMVRGDDSQLVLLLQNLIGNAIKFRGKEAPRIHISATNESRKMVDDGQKTIVPLQTQFSEPKEGWVFSVKDNGIGIDPHYKDRIFLTFTRLHGREEYPGNGIGLAVCKKIVEYHKGRIWIESEPGKGSIFYFTLAETGVLK